MSNPCHNGGTCNNRYGGYTCTCKPGNANPDCLKFVYECASNPCKNGGTCQDGQNNYTCYCPPGTQGKNQRENKHYGYPVPGSEWEE